jgi:hypothetical protein
LASALDDHSDCSRDILRIEPDDTLRHQHTGLFQLSTWRSAWRHLFAKEGLFTSSYAAWKAYFHADFHPLSMTINCRASGCKHTLRLSKPFIIALKLLLN